ncbi:MAG: hypothetical protein ACTHXO_00345 [Actinomycetaceae bacterium]
MDERNDRDPAPEPEDDVGETVRRPFRPLPGGPRGGADTGADPGYGSDEGVSYPGSTSPVPTGEHVVAGSWSTDDVESSVETTTGTYAVQAPDGGYDGYAAVGAGQYRSGGVDPYQGQIADPFPAAPAHGGAASYGAPIPGVGGRPGSYGYAGTQDPGAGQGRGGSGAGVAGPHGPGGGRRGPSKAPVVVVGVVVALVVVLLAALGLGRLFGDDETAGPEETPAAPAPSPAPTGPPSSAPPVPGGEGSAGGDGDVDSPAYVVDAAGNELGAVLEGAFPQDGRYTSTLHVSERSAVVVAAYSPDLNNLEVTISTPDGDVELTDSDVDFSFIDFSGYASTSDPGGALVLEPGDYEMVVTEERGAASAFELVVLSGSSELAPGDETDVDVEPGGAELFLVPGGEGQGLTGTLVGESSDPMLYIARPDGAVYQNDDWSSSPGYTGEDPPSSLDAALTVAGTGAGEDGAAYVVVATTYAGQGGTATLSVDVG